MKYCCENFEEWHNSARVRWYPDAGWVFCINSELTPNPNDWKWNQIIYCPFCGKNLQDRFAGEEKYPQDENMD